MRTKKGSQPIPEKMAFPGPLGAKTTGELIELMLAKVKAGKARRAGRTFVYVAGGTKYVFLPSNYAETKARRYENFPQTCSAGEDFVVQALRLDAPWKNCPEHGAGQGAPSDAESFLLS